MKDCDVTHGDRPTTATLNVDKKPLTKSVSFSDECDVTHYANDDVLCDDTCQCAGEDSCFEFSDHGVSDMLRHPEFQGMKPTFI